MHSLHSKGAVTIRFMNLAGFPVTMVSGSTYFVTTLSALTTLFSPIVTPRRIVEPTPIHTLRQIRSASISITVLNTSATRTKPKQSII